mmetsp:Transcript_31/g.99  ORF Transcript_31/g.99 Transcript_31/m.99 type:complete len:95 (+) Transcript_31:177-461(+)
MSWCILVYARKATSMTKRRRRAGGRAEGRKRKERKGNPSGKVLSLSPSLSLFAFFIPFNNKNRIVTEGGGGEETGGTEGEVPEFNQQCSVSSTN